MVREVSSRDCFEPFRALPRDRKCHHAGGLRAGRGGGSFAKWGGELVRDYVHLVLECDFSHSGGGPNAEVFTRYHYQRGALHSAGCARLFQSAATEVGAVGGSTRLFRNWQLLSRVLAEKPSAKSKGSGGPSLNSKQLAGVCVIAILSPLRGSLVSPTRHPRLAPWAAFFRRFAAWSAQFLPLFQS